MKLLTLTIVLGVSGIAILSTGCARGEPNNSFFTSWSHYKVGTETEYQLSVVQQGGTMSLPLYYKLVDSASDKVTLELNMPAAQRVTIPADISSEAKVEGELMPEMIGARGWPNLLYQLPYPPFVKRLTGHEAVVVDGVPYQCRFGDATVSDMKITQWFSDKVPGGLVKAEVIGKLPGGEDPKGSMKLTLSKIKLM